MSLSEHFLAVRVFLMQPLLHVPVHASIQDLHVTRLIERLSFFSWARGC